MRFDKSGWFNRLEKAINEVCLDHDFFIYLIEIGEIKFQVVIEKNALFNKAIEAFYASSIIQELIVSIPVIYCVDQNLASEIIRGAGREIISSNFYQDNKRFEEKYIVMNDVSRSCIKALNVKKGLGLFACQDFKNLPSWEFFSPLKEFIHLIALQSDCWLAHGGSIVDKHKGILFVGPGKSGKSSTTISLISHQMKTAGDDYVCLSKDYKVYAIYRTIKHKGDRFTQFLDYLKEYETSLDAQSQKTVYFCNRVSEEGPFVDSFELKSIYGLELTLESMQKMLVSDDLKFNYFFMTTASQIPLWIDQSMKLASLIFKKIDKKFIVLPTDDASHHDFLNFLTKNIHESY